MKRRRTPEQIAASMWKITRAGHTRGAECVMFGHEFIGSFVNLGGATHCAEAVCRVIARAIRADRKQRARGK